MMRYYVELGNAKSDEPNISFYVKGWSIEHVRDIFCHEEIIAVDQTD